MAKKVAKKATKTTAKSKASSSKASSSRTRTPRQKKVGLSLDAPDAHAVVVTGSFCGWDEGISMKRDRGGVWKTTLTLPSGDYEYRFRVDGEWRDDPACSERTPNRFGSQNCVLHV